jgi:hypothetical protein
MLATFARGHFGRFELASTSRLNAAECVARLALV